MAGVVLPINFDEQTKLFNQIKAKHDADGAGSVLNMLLAEQNIDLAADDVSRAAAVDANIRQSKEFKLAEELREKRDLLFTPIFSSYKDMVQFLKTIYNPNYKKLGDWGVHVVGSARIVYPSSLSNRIDSVRDFVKKFNSLPPAENPILFYLANHPEVAMPTFAQLDAILAIHKDFEQIRKNVEEATEARNVLWQPVMAHVRIIADYLKKLFYRNPAMLGQYGFTINYAKKTPKYRNTSIKLGQIKIVSGVIIGAELHNRGNTELLIYKGRQIKGEPIKVLPNSSLIIPKGYSNITVVNPSNIETGKYQVLLKKK